MHFCGEAILKGKTHLTMSLEELWDDRGEGHHITKDRTPNNM